MNSSKAENNKRVKQQPQQDNTRSEGQSIIQERGLGSETGDGNKIGNMNKIIMIIISPRTLLTLNCKPSASSLWGRGR